MTTKVPHVLILTLQMDRAVGGFAKTESTKNESIACYVLSALLLGTRLSGSVVTDVSDTTKCRGPSSPRGVPLHQYKFACQAALDGRSLGQPLTSGMGFRLFLPPGPFANSAFAPISKRCTLWTDMAPCPRVSAE